MTLLILCILSLTTAFLLVSLNMTNQSRSKLQAQLLAQGQWTLWTKDQEIQRLTNLLASKDPMTFQILSQVPTTSLVSNDPYQPTGTDESEYVKWMNAQGFTDTQDDEIAQDLLEMGL